jgi:hypothetical protein
VVLFVETPRAVQHVFSFPVLNFPRFQKWSAVSTRIRDSVSISFLLLF